MGEYDGTIITVSHDRFFLDQIATQIFSFEPNGRIETFNGNYSEFHDWKEKRAESEKKKVENNSIMESTQKTSVPAQKLAEIQKLKTSNLSKNEIQKIQTRISTIEKSIPKIEEELKQLTFQMNQPDLTADHENLKSISANYEKVENKLQKIYSEWEELLEKIG